MAPLKSCVEIILTIDGKEENHHFVKLPGDDINKEQFDFMLDHFVTLVKKRV